MHDEKDEKIATLQEVTAVACHGRMLHLAWTSLVLLVDFGVVPASSCGREEKPVAY